MDELKQRNDMQQLQIEANEKLGENNIANVGKAGAYLRVLRSARTCSNERAGLKTTWCKYLISGCQNAQVA